MDLLQSVGSTALADPYRPSFFELFAQEQMRDLLAPALRYVLSVLAQRHPRWLLRIVNRFDELYALGMYAVERHYLNTWGEPSIHWKWAVRADRVPTQQARPSPRISMDCDGGGGRASRRTEPRQRRQGRRGRDRHRTRRCAGAR